LSYTTLASWPLLIWKALEAAGHDPQPVFAIAKINREQLAKSGSRVTEARLERCWIEAARVHATGCFGLTVSNHWHPTTLHALGIACLASPTLGDAFQRFVRYSKVVTDATDFHLEQQQARYRFSWDFVHESVTDHVEEQHATLGTVLNMARFCSSASLQPLSVHLIHSPTGCAEEMEAFFGCPIVYDEPRYGLSFAAVDLDTPLPTANIDMIISSEQVIADYLAGLVEGDLVTRARGVILRQLPSGTTTEESVAAALNLSLRTLQRRLRENDTVYRELLESVRRDLAGKYLANSRYSITEISYLLGFSEPSSFARSFRRWNGTSPTALRRATA